MSPSVFPDGDPATNIGQFMRLNYRDITLLLCCGAAGALSAVFKAPITGVVFVLEILMLDITVSSIIPLLISTVTATSLMFFLNGFEPVFSIEIKTFSLHNIPFYVVLGTLCGFMSYYFTRINTAIGGAFARLRTLGRKWLVGGVVIGLIALPFVWRAPSALDWGWLFFMSGLLIFAQFDILQRQCMVQKTICWVGFQHFFYFIYPVQFKKII